MNGYEEATKIDALIGKLIKKYPPTESNALGWLAFTRTVISTLEIARQEALEILKGKAVIEV